MLGKYHLAFNLVSVLPFYLYLYNLGYNILVLFVSLILFILFSNFPDFDISYKGALSRRVVRLVFMFPFYVVAKITNDSVAHRHITHSIKGIITFSIFILFLWRMIYYLLYHFIVGNYLLRSVDVVFSSFLVPVSIIMTYFLHVMGDAVTMNGVPLFKGKRVHGFIVTGKNDAYYVSLYVITQLLVMIYFLKSYDVKALFVISVIVLIVFISLPILFAPKKGEYYFHI
ncbi:MAG: metal-dependent hydrolase [Thermoprotei archaeon]